MASKDIRIGTKLNGDAPWDDNHTGRLGPLPDVLAWLTTTASLAGVDMTEAAERFAGGCPKCDRTPCECGKRRA